MDDPRFLIVGLGGLGSPLALTLAAASPRTRLILVDDDVVDLSNLQRQILYRTEDVGQRKTVAARAALLRRGVDPARLEVVDARFDAGTAPGLVARADVVCDGSDNLETKFLVNDACVAGGRPFVVAGVLRHSGQAFPVRPGEDACYRCLFEAPPEEDVLTCADAGVLGATVGEVAAFQARCALALAGLRDGAGLLGRFWLFERDERRSLAIVRSPGCAACGDGPARAREGT